MREIKFRAWDTQDKVMRNGDVIGDGNSRSLNNEIESLVERGFILQQFTGLKDKNGKEIYEGDILRCVPTDDYPKDGGVFAVHFNSESAFVINTSLPVTWGGYKTVEVIGNIYENKELAE